MNRRTACGLLALGALSRLRAEDSPWDAATKAGLDALEQGRRKEARDNLALALAEAKKANAGELIIAECIDNLALATEFRGIQREDLYRDSLVLRQEVLKAGDPEIARSLAHVASALYQPAQRSEAEGLLDSAQRIAEIDPKSELMAEILETRGVLRHRQYFMPSDASDLQKDVEPLYRRALAIRETYSGPGDLSLAQILELTAVLLQATKRDDQGLPLRTRAAEIRKRHIEKLSPPLVAISTPHAGAQSSADPTTPGQAASPPGQPPKVTPPQLTHKEEPAYSDIAFAVKWQGDVGLQIVVTEAGSPAQIRLVSSLGLGLDEEALFAVRGWRFTPGQRENTPVNVIANIEVNFRLL